MSTCEDTSGDLGVVIKKNNGTYWVRSNGQTVICLIAMHLRKCSEQKPPVQGKRKEGRGPAPTSEHEDILAIGDTVRFTRGQAGPGKIVAIQARRNRLSRRSTVPMPGAHAFEQVIAANVDLVVPVFAAAAPEPTWNLLDRYLASAESLELPVLICITKLDLALDMDGLLDEDLANAVEEYRRIGYPVCLTSMQGGDGIAALQAALAGKVAVLVGKSGVGKTSLLNALQPGLGRQVGEVNGITGKGRHITSAAEMYPLDFGGAIVDTPGVHEFGLWDVALNEMALFFPEMRPYVGHCRFGINCQHTDQPGCAIRKAVMAGQINPRRYQSYLKLREDEP